MTDYKQQALDFLKTCNATMEIEFLHVDINQNWNDNTKRNKYRFTITTPKGKMTGNFWDSVINTQITLMTPEDYSMKHYGQYYDGLMPHVKTRIRRILKEAKVKCTPTPYDILACLQKYDPGTMHEFFDEFCYEVNSVDDMFSFMNTYNAVVKEYRDLCRIFTEEQMEILREIS